MICKDLVKLKLRTAINKHHRHQNEQNDKNDEIADAPAFFASFFDVAHILFFFIVEKSVFLTSVL
jgi:hypothetical protein